MLFFTNFLLELLHLGFSSTSIAEKVEDAASDGDLLSSDENLSTCRNMHQTMLREEGRHRTINFSRLATRSFELNDRSSTCGGLTVPNFNCTEGTTRMDMWEIIAIELSGNKFRPAQAPAAERKKMSKIVVS